MTLWSDLRRAVLALRREPMLAIAATLTLAIAIGANTAVFSIVDTILIRPLPYRHSDRLYWIAERTERSPAGAGYAADYYSLRERQCAFEEVAALAFGDMNWSGPDRPEYLHAVQVSPSFFPVMGAQLPESRAYRTRISAGPPAHVSSESHRLARRARPILCRRAGARSAPSHGTFRHHFHSHARDQLDLG